MNSLKTLFVSAVMVVVLYGVYKFMNPSPEPSPPLEAAAAWNGEINIEPGTVMRTAAASPNGQIQLRAPATAPAVTLPSCAAKESCAAPKMAMNFAFPGDAPGSSPASPPPAVPPAAPPASPALAAGKNFEMPPAVNAGQKDIAPYEVAPKQANPQDAFPAMPGGQSGLPSPQKFDDFMAVVRGELDRGRILDAYRLLSSRYPAVEFTAEENIRVEQLLDRLAATVVYSKHHVLEQPYRVGENETLEQIAERYNVPPQFLARINGISPGQTPEAGSELKVVRGPLSAEIDLNKRELTLRLPDGGYAGRFSVGIGRDVPGINKEYRVYDKMATPASSPVTPAGYSPEVSPAQKPQKWIGLEGRLGIHPAADKSEVGRDGAQGGIVLEDRDVDDLYDILSVGSRVAVRR